MTWCDSLTTLKAFQIIVLKEISVTSKKCVVDAPCTTLGLPSPCPLHRISFSFMANSHLMNHSWTGIMNINTHIHTRKGTTFHTQARVFSYTPKLHVAYSKCQKNI